MPPSTFAPKLVQEKLDNPEVIFDDCGSQEWLGIVKPGQVWICLEILDNQLAGVDIFHVNGSPKSAPIVAASLE